MARKLAVGLLVVSAIGMAAGLCGFAGVIWRARASGVPAREGVCLAVVSILAGSVGVMAGWGWLVEYPDST